MAEDKSIIALTLKATAIIDKLLTSNEFNENQDIARFAFSYAMNNRLYDSDEQYDIGDKKGMSWHSGNIDADNIMSTLVKSMFPDETQPFRFIEKMINIGLIDIGLKLGERQFNITEFI